MEVGQPVLSGPGSDAMGRLTDGIKGAARIILARLGYAIDVYEVKSVAGGVPAWAVPEFKLLREVLAKEVKATEDQGVKIHLNTEVGNDITLAELRKTHDAVYTASGAKEARKLKIKGSELGGVVGAIDFLKEVAMQGKRKVEGNVVVIGGGRIGMDAARAALRYGAKDVRLFCVEPESEMFATEEAIGLAKRRGIQITNSAGPVQFIGKSISTFQEVSCGYRAEDRKRELLSS